MLCWCAVNKLFTYSLSSSWVSFWSLLVCVCVNICRNFSDFFFLFFSKHKRASTPRHPLSASVCTQTHVHSRHPLQRSILSLGDWIERQTDRRSKVRQQQNGQWDAVWCQGMVSCVSFPDNFSDVIHHDTSHWQSNTMAKTHNRKMTWIHVTNTMVAFIIKNPIDLDLSNRDRAE